jgi:hypothetical protein
MKRITLILLAILLVLALTSCKGRRDAAKMPTDEIKAQIATYSPLPSFKEAFRLLEDFQTKDYAPGISNQLYRIKPQGPYNAFALGVLTADAAMAAKARNKKQLTSVSAEMMNLCSLMGLETDVKRLSTLLTSNLQQGKWNDVEKTLDYMKKTLEDKLWELEDYEYYTLMILGGWTETLNSLGRLLTANYSPEATKALGHESAWDSMQANFELFTNPAIKDTQTYKDVGELIPKVSQLLAGHTDNTYTKEQVEELTKLTEQIKQAFPAK